MYQPNLFDLDCEIAPPADVIIDVAEPVVESTVSTEARPSASSRATLLASASKVIADSDDPFPILADADGGAASTGNGEAGAPLPEPTGDHLLDDLLLESATAPSFCRRRLAGHLAGERRAGRPLARRGQSYAEKVVLAAAGIPWDLYVQDAGLRAAMARFGSRFPLSDHQIEAVALDCEGVTFVAFVNAHLDEMERLDVAVLRMHAGRSLPSAQWWADYMSVPRSLICNNGNLRDQLNKRLKAGTLKLGGVFVDPRKLSKAQLRALRKQMDKVFARLRSERQPVPSHPERSDKIWFDPMLDEGEVFDPHHRDMLMINKHLRVDLTNLIDDVGMAPLGTEAARGVTVSYALLCDREKDAVALVRQAYRRDNPDEPAEGSSENRHVDNELSYLNRFRKRNGREPDADAAPDFSDGDDEAYEARRALGRTASVKGNENYEDSVDRWRGIAFSVQAAGEFPATFFGAFATAMDLRRIDAATLAAKIGAPRKLIYSWRSGRSFPTVVTEHLVTAAAVALEVPPALFASRLGELATGIARDGRTHVTLSDGRRIQLSYWWRRLPKGAAGWSDAKLVPVLEAAVARHTRKATVASVRRSAAKRNIWGLPAEDPACRIWGEWDDLVRFKRGVAGDHRVQLADDNWNTSNSIRVYRTFVAGLESWCRLPVEQGGLGLHPDQVSFRLLLNPAIAKRYLVWRVRRCAGEILNGKPIGIQIVSTERNIAGFFSSLTELDFGWLTQSAAELGLPEPIATTVRVPVITYTKPDVQIVDDDTCPEAEVLPAALVDRMGSDWVGVIVEARRHLRALKSNFQLGFKLIADPKELIMPIVKHTSPIAVMLRMIREALKRVRPIETAPKRHARDYMRIVVALMLTLVVFRSETLRGTTWRSDGTGQLRWVDGRNEYQPDGSSNWIEGHYELVVDADRFKNVTSALLFGPSWNRRAYERDLKNWGGLDGILKHFIEVCRPILLDGRESDLLFPPPKPQRTSTRDKVEWSESDFHYLVESFTQMWCVHNANYGTGMHGVQPFGPHPFRDIVATHILKHWKGEDRWELAARILGTGEEQVRTRYGWIDTRAELAKADPIFDEASALAMSDVPLW